MPRHCCLTGKFISLKLPAALAGVVILLGTFIGHYTAAQPSSAERLVRLVADGVLTEADSRFVNLADGQIYTSLSTAPAQARLRPVSTFNDWRYWSGVLNLALLEAGAVLQETTYTQFVLRNMAFQYDHYAYFQRQYRGENKWDYPFGQLFNLEELDDCGAMGASLIEVVQQDHQERYLEYLTKAADHILNKQARLPDGTLVRTFPQKWTLWADDLYMGVVFLCRMNLPATGLPGRQGLEEAIRQVLNYQRYLFDEQKGLMYHNWYSATQQRGVACWGRANGWAILAQSDLLDHLPPDHPQRATLLKLYRRHIDGLLRYQDATGLWHQLLDKPDSYLETSCSAIFTYAIAHGVCKGYLPKSYSPAALLGWQGVSSRIRPDGKIEGICTGTGIYDELQEYYRRPTPLNDPHGIGFVILAGLAIRQMAL